MTRCRLDIDHVRAIARRDQSLAFMRVFDGQIVAVPTKPDVEHFDTAIGDAARETLPCDGDIVTHAQPA